MPSHSGRAGGPRRPARPLTTGLAVAALLAVPALVGCEGASSEGSLAILDEEPAGPVPEEVNSYGILEPGSARHLGTAHGVDYYVGEEAATRGIVCLVSVPRDPPDESGGAACSTESPRMIVTLEDVNGEAALVGDDADTDALPGDGWSEVSRNLWTR